MDRTTTLIVMAAGMAGAYLLAEWQRGQGSADPSTGAYDTSTDEPYSFDVEDLMSSFTNPITRALGLWAAPAAYASTIADAEAKNGIPDRMLERLLWQECRWRADIISGAKRSPVGAIGIAQFMPATAADEGVNPLDPIASIYAAGRYLAKLFRKFGNWSEALASYNWGQGNVARKGLASAPLETVTYYSQILADVNNATGSNYA